MAIIFFPDLTQIINFVKVRKRTNSKSYLTDKTSTMHGISLTQKCDDLKFEMFTSINEIILLHNYFSKNAVKSKKGLGLFAIDGGTTPLPVCKELERDFSAFSTRK